VSENFAGANVHRNIGVIPFRKEDNTKFFLYAMCSPLIQKQIEQHISGATQPLFNLNDLKKIEIPLPPLAEQHEIVRRVDALFARADAVEREAAAATKRAEALTQAVLAKAFAGKL
jgi:type I restriction enzyme S subunit